MKRMRYWVVLAALCATFLFYPQTYRFIYRTCADGWTFLRLSMQSEMPPAPPDEKRTKVVFMFDDGWRSVFTHAYPLFKQYGFTGSVAIIPSLIKEGEYLSFEEIGILKVEGWDILNHSYTHREQPYPEAAEELADYERAKVWMEKRQLKQGSKTAVAPYGAVSEPLALLLKQAGYTSIRTSEHMLVFGESEIVYFPTVTVQMLTHVQPEELERTVGSLSEWEDVVLLIFHKLDSLADGYGMTYSPELLAEVLSFFAAHQNSYQVVPYTALFA